MKCPGCGKDLGTAISCDLNSVGWSCSECRIKIYKEIEE